MPKINHQPKNSGKDANKGNLSPNFEDIFNAHIDGIIDDREEMVDVVTFTESPYYLNMKPHPVQRFILKSFYHIPFDDVEKTIHVRF